MGRKSAVIFMIAVTIGVFIMPRLYYQRFDTRLSESRRDYRYSVKIDSNLDFEQKKEMLLNKECLVNEEDFDEESVVMAKIAISNELKNIYYQEDSLANIIKSVDIFEFAYENKCFKLVYVDDASIKTLLTGVCIFISDIFKGFAVYDAVTYDIYALYIIECRYYDNWTGAEELKLKFNTEEISDSSAINEILEKTSLKSIDISYETEKSNLLELFKRNFAYENDMEQSGEEVIIN